MQNDGLHEQMPAPSLTVCSHGVVRNMRRCDMRTEQALFVFGGLVRVACAAMHDAWHVSFVDISARFSGLAIQQDTTRRVDPIGAGRKPKPRRFVECERAESVLRRERDYLRRGGRKARS